MLSIFKKAVSAFTAAVAYPIFVRIASIFRSNLARVRDYYDYGNYVVPSNHFLVTLINSIAVSHSMSIERFITLTYQAGVSAGRNIGLGSAVAPMRVFNESQFYGSGTQEVIYLTDTEFPIDSPELWLGLNPIKVWRHSDTAFTFKRLVGVNLNKPGLSVIEINLPLLMCQFRHFMNQQLELPEDQRKDVRHFVSNVIVGLTESHLDVASFNRVVATLKGEPVTDAPVMSGISLQDASANSETFMRQVVENLTNRTLTWENALALIPMPFAGNALDFFHLPEQISNRYSRCFEFLATYDAIMFLLDLDEKSPGDKNTPYKTALRVYLDRVESEALWQTFSGDTSSIQTAVRVLRERL